MASGQTENYGLNQWAGTDKFVRTEFNENFEKIDAALGAKAEQAELSNVMATMADLPRIVTGTYIGNGATSRVINLGFRPKLVYVCLENGISAHTDSGNDIWRGGLALDGFPAMPIPNYYSVEIVDGGFAVMEMGTIRTNVSKWVYYYCAVK